MSAIFTPSTAPVVTGGILDLEAADVESSRGVLGELFAGDRLGLVVHGAVDPAECAALVAALASDAPPVAPEPMEHFDGQSFGPTLIVWPGEREGYLAAAEVAGPALANASPIGARVDALLSVLGDLPVATPESADGRPYCPRNVRMVRPGSGIALHCENETVGFPSMSELAPRLDPRTQLSFYVLLAAPDGGGILRIEPLRHGEESGYALASLPRRDAEVEAALDELSANVPAMSPGDLVVFDAGRNFHRVTEVEGHRPRWTLGGFLGLRRDGATLLRWS